MARLRAVPATRFCVNCARAQETPAAAEVEIPTVGPLPADMSLLTDRELEDALRELVREDGRIDMEELRLVCRHGVVVLDGALPSETEHQILRKLMTDVAGLLELVDRLQVKEILWDRLDRSKRVPGAVEPLRAEPSGTEDVVKSLEEGLDFVPPAGPAAEEE